MGEKQQMDEQAAQANEPENLEALIALIEARVVENLTRAMERIALERENGAARTEP